MNQHERNILFSLVFKCPFDLDCKNCPIEPIRQMEIRERLEYASKIEEEELCRLVSEHYKNYWQNYDVGTIRTGMLSYILKNSYIEFHQ
jgi:hypothetical protein